MTVRHIAQPVQIRSRLDQILNVKLNSIFKQPRHLLICGASGSGKTSALLLMLDLLYKNGETIIWRDDSSMEVLSVADYYPIRIFVPEGCSIDFKHKNVEYVTYNPLEEGLTSLFSQIKKDAINAIEFDLFAFEMQLFVKFWSEFFYNLYKWKRTKLRMPIALLTDELNDLCPSQRKGSVPQQTRLSSNIYFAFKKYRKEHVRLVASTHSYIDVSKSVRTAFDFYICKRLDEQNVPECVWQYGKVFERLGIDDFVIIDEARNFNRMKIEEFVKPRKFSIRWSGELKMPLPKKMQTELELANEKIAVLSVLAKNFGATFDDIAKLLNYGAPSTVSSLVRRHVNQAQREKIEAVLKKLNAPEQQAAAY